MYFHVKEHISHYCTAYVQAASTHAYDNLTTTTTTTTRTTTILYYNQQHIITSSLFNIHKNSRGIRRRGQVSSPNAHRSALPPSPHRQHHHPHQQRDSTHSRRDYKRTTSVWRCWWWRMCVHICTPLHSRVQPSVDSRISPDTCMLYYAYCKGRLRCCMHA